MALRDVLRRTGLLKPALAAVLITGLASSSLGHMPKLPYEIIPPKKTVKTFDGTLNFPLRVRSGGKERVFKDWNEYMNHVASVAYKHCKSVDFEVEPGWVMAHLKHESDFHPFAKGDAGERGIAQMIPETRQRLSDKYSIKYRGENVYDIDYNIKGAVLLMLENRKRINSFEGFGKKFPTAEKKYHAYAGSYLYDYRPSVFKERVLQRVYNISRSKYAKRVWESYNKWKVLFKKAHEIERERAGKAAQKPVVPMRKPEQARQKIPGR
jgi:hypothetical protein